MRGNGMSNEKEQFQRFSELFNGGIPCVHCPLDKQCHNDPNVAEHTCEETLWHWVKTGRFLI